VSYADGVLSEIQDFQTALCVLSECMNTLLMVATIEIAGEAIARPLPFTVTRISAEILLCFVHLVHLALMAP